MSVLWRREQIYYSKKFTRWRLFYLVQTVVDANNTQFKDIRSKEVKLNLESAASDLHAADASYHQECKTNFLHLSYLDRLAKTSETDIDNALPCVKVYESQRGKHVEQCRD